MSKIVNDHPITQKQSKRSWFFIIILALLFLLTISRLFLSSAIIYGTNTWLKKQGITSDIEEININILNGHVSLINVVAKKDTKELFHINLLEFYWQWSPLSNKTIAISQIKLDKFNTNIELYTDTLIIGGLQLPLNKDPEIKTRDNTEKDWTLSLNKLEISNINLCYSQQAAPVNKKTNNHKLHDYCLEVGKFSWQGPFRYSTDDQRTKGENRIYAKGDLSLKDFSVIDNKQNKELLSTKLSTFSDIHIDGLNSINIPKLAIKNLSALQRSNDANNKDTVSFNSLSIDGLKLVNLNSLSAKNITFDKPKLYLVKNNVNNWEYQTWLPTPKSNNKTSTTGAAFNISINDFIVKNSYFCYLERQSSLDYCFTLENLKWLGSTQITTASQSEPLTINASGNLSLTQASINNQTNKRSLINASALNLSNLTVRSANDFSITDLSIEKFDVLQRSVQLDDTTASFEKLLINSLDYSNNNISLDKINVDGLSTTVSKNKEGGWEHAQWLHNDPKPNADSENSSTEKQANKLLGFSLNHLTILSNNKITYRDEGTLPPTNISLQNLNFTIDNLDSSNVNSASPFKLLAKTIEHSSIELEGEITPFADKISFNAKGEVKGYDLRSVSALTKKSVGHVIKSGQMDAHLKLKAIDGKLDSNIELSLFQFEIKPVTKADANKLDKLFGIPLNQTLTLLRDRNDNIHLNIPVTGNFNNPNFNPMDAIIKATSTAATVTLITFYTPYGLIYAGSNALFDIATALNFEPVFFDAGTSELILPVLDEDGEDQLLNLTKLMKDKPKVHLTLCGKTNLSDFLALYPKTKNNTGTEKLKLSTTQRDALHQLATERQANIKNYLTKQAGLAHGRLILCEPEHKMDKDAIAGVEINI